MDNTSLLIMCDNSSTTEYCNNSDHRIFDRELSNIVIYVFQFFIGLVAIVIILSNGMVVAVVCKFKALQTFTNWFVLNLAVSDLFSGVNYAVCFPITTFYHHRGVCHACIFITYVLMLETIVMMAIVTTERFIAIIWAVKYKSMFNKTVVARLICLSWIYSLILTVPVVIADTYDAIDVCIFELVINKFSLFFLYFNIAIIMAVMMVMYSYMYSVVRRRHQRRVTSTRSRQQQDAAFQRRQRTALLMFIVVATYTACTLPFMLNTVVLLTAGYSATYATLRRFTLVLIFLNSGTNPWIYAYVNENFRRAFRVILPCRSVQVHPSDLHVPATTYGEDTLDPSRSQSHANHPQQATTSTLPPSNHDATDAADTC